MDVSAPGTVPNPVSLLASASVCQSREVSGMRGPLSSETASPRRLDPRRRSRPSAPDSGGHRGPPTKSGQVAGGELGPRGADLSGPDQLGPGVDARRPWDRDRTHLAPDPADAWAAPADAVISRRSARTRGTARTGRLCGSPTPVGTLWMHPEPVVGEAFAEDPLGAPRDSHQNFRQPTTSPIGF
jgi:hypothetical protein